MMSLSAHKCYGPMGVGALYVRWRSAPGVRRVQLEPILHGGGQERGLRSGTLNVSGIVGFGRAGALGAAALPTEAARISRLRDTLFTHLRASIPGVRLNGHPTQRLPGTLNVSFLGVDTEALLGSLPDVAVSAGSACASLKPEPSHVLRAMGLEDESATAVRFSLGRFTTPDEVERAAALVVLAAGEPGSSIVGSPAPNAGLNRDDV
jgi:cysteine desulfurase